ncbi:MAG: acyl-CoA dehydrogenase family protein [Egibacteraceae bacterium]
MSVPERPDFLLVDELLNAEERALREKVRAFCESEVLGVVNDYWERAAMPFELVAPLAELGIAGGTISGYGCPGLSELADGMITAELARADGSLSTFHGVQTGLAMTTIAELGSDEQRQRWLPAMARMERLGAFALTEPDHGSDIVALETRAHRDGDGWVLNGAKRWIGNGSVADLVIVWARDDDGDVGGFVVETPAEGFTAEVITGKTSNRALWQADITLEDVRIPADHRLAEARTFEDTSRVLANSRQGVAWEALGHAIGAYESALAYTGEREQFGRPLASFQLVQAKLVDMITQITTMQLLCVRMAQLQEAGRMTMARASLAKRHNAAAARRVCAEARDVLGGNGILLEHHVARHQADVEAVYTYEGTDSVQALIVGREITGLSAFT